VDQLTASLPKDVGYYLKGAGSLLVSQGAGIVLGLLGTYLLTNFAAPETYADYGYVWSALGIAGLATLPGVDMAIQYAAARGYKGALRHGTALRLKTSVFGVAGMLLLAVGLLVSGRVTTARVVAIGAVLLPLTHGFNGFAAHLQGQGRFVEYATASLLVDTGRLVLTAIAVVVLRLDGVPLIGVLLLAAGGLTTAVCLTHLRQSHGEPGPEFHTVSRSLSISAVLGTLAYYADRLIIGTFFGPEQMAGYVLGITLTEPLRNVGNLLAKLLFPKVVQTGLHAPLFLRRLGLMLGVLACGLGAVVALYWFGFPLLQPVVFTQYANAVPMVRWLIVAAALGAFDLVAIQMLWGLRDLRPIYVTQIAFPLVRIVTLGLGAWSVGIVGILRGQVIYYSVVAIFACAMLLVLALRARQPSSTAKEGM
jgi:O-antigen/teichoic acid export membrane protein